MEVTVKERVKIMLKEKGNGKDMGKGEDKGKGDVFKS